MKTLMPMKAAPIDDDAFRLLAFPFTGPIPHPGTRGVDSDLQWFSERTDIKPNWLPFRPLDWHHGNDFTGTMGRTVLGKAVDLGRFDGAAKGPDDDGWWVTVWLDQGQKKLGKIRRMADEAIARGQAFVDVIFGSSETIPGMGRLRTAKGEIPWRPNTPGEITVWPYWRQTLSTSPQNTHSIIRPLKATLDEIAAAGEVPGAAFWSDLESALRSLGPSLQLPPRAEVEAKAGRVLSARNESDLRAALDGLQSALDLLAAVVRRNPDYTMKDQST